MVPKYLTLTSYNNSFQEIGTCFWQKLTVWQGKFVLSKKHLKMAYFCVHESGLPNFGRLWTPNPWHQANFSGTPEILRVWRFNGLCERSVASKLNTHRFNTFSPRRCTEIGEKDSENVFGFGDRAPFRSYSGSKWGHRPKIGRVTQNMGCYKSKSLCQFLSILGSLLADFPL